MHSTDWLPTLLRVAGIDKSVTGKIDGIDMWDMISDGYGSKRFEIFHNFDPLQSNQAALRVGDYKLIVNQDVGYFGDWYPRPAEVVNHTYYSFQSSLYPSSSSSSFSGICILNASHFTLLNLIFFFYFLFIIFTFLTFAITFV